MKMTELQFEMIKENLRQLTSKDCFYKEKLKEIDVEAIKTQEDFEKLLEAKEESMDLVLTGKVFPEKLRPYVDAVSSISYMEVDKQNEGC